MTTENAAQGHVGSVLHSPLLYDAIVWFALRGRERQLRDRLLELARLRAGESVLDVGCGTGTLAIRAQETVGRSGTVCGVDASVEMLARARAKAARAGVPVRFENAAAQSLPFADSSFDLALGTMMLHHLSRGARRDFAAELRRVVRPRGRVFLADFAGTEARAEKKAGGFAGHFRHRHGHVDIAEIVELLAAAGFQSIESGAVGVRNLHFALARAAQK